MARALRRAPHDRRNASLARREDVAGNLQIGVGRGEGTARVLLVGFDNPHQMAVGRGENSGRTLVEANIVRSITMVARWTGQPLNILDPLPFGEDEAVPLQSPDGTIIGAAALGHR